MYDLHLHTTYSDGDFTVARLIQEAARRGVQGISITDHNGVWGAKEAQTVAAATGLAFLPGIEVTASVAGMDVHVLGYSQSFNESFLTERLAITREGYRARIQAMTAQCQDAGFTRISFADIEASRQQQATPCYVSYDVAKQLAAQHHLGTDEARRLTVHGGACYVPYGDWALRPQQAVDLLHEAGGVASLAHPGIILQEHGSKALQALLEDLTHAGLDAIEVYHPFHSPQVTAMLSTFAIQHGLCTTGGSDWHGPGRYHDTSFGTMGLTTDLFKNLDSLLNHSS